MDVLTIEEQAGYRELPSVTGQRSVCLHTDSSHVSRRRRVRGPAGPPGPPGPRGHDGIPGVSILYTATLKWSVKKYSV